MGFRERQQHVNAAAGEECEPGSSGGSFDCTDACVAVVPSGMCRDPQTGTLRALEWPMMGQLRIVEIMANPAVISDAAGEWVELEASASFDLNELVVTIGTSSAWLPLFPNRLDCLEVEAGEFVLIARTDDPTTNGGLPPVDALLPSQLVNTDGSLRIGLPETLLDELSWGATESGVALNVDSTGRQCPATTPYFPENFGTPAHSNTPCP